MEEEGEYSKRRKWVYTRQRYEERYGFHNGKTYIWEIEQVINKKHFQPGINQKFTGPCVNAPIKQEEQEKVIQSGNRAPWMQVALNEAKNYGGIHESKIDNRITQYHKEGANYTAGSKTAWCASFVSWCLKQVNLKNPSTTGSRFFITSSTLEKTEVFYGAIAVFSDCDAKGVIQTSGHVSLVLGKLPSKNMYACLGGNQSDMLKVSSYDCSGNVFVSYTTKEGVPKYKICRGFYKPIDYKLNEGDYLTQKDEYKSVAKANSMVINLNLEMNKDGESSR